MKNKTVKTTIKPNDVSFIGQKLVFEDFHKRTTIGTITHVTQDRVIWITEDGKEGWTWRGPNGKNASFDLLNDGKNKKFVKALEMEQAYLKLQNEYEDLSQRYNQLIQLISEFENFRENFKKNE